MGISLKCVNFLRGSGLGVFLRTESAVPMPGMLLKYVDLFRGFGLQRALSLESETAMAFKKDSKEVRK